MAENNPTNQSDSVDPADTKPEQLVTPNPQAAAEIEAISHEPVAMKVAHAPPGSNEDSDYAA
jgi:hypothetical protein